MNRNQKLVNKLISEVLKEYVFLEAEGDEAGGGNPFAAAADAEKGGGDAAAAAGGGEAEAEAGAEAGAEGGEEEKKDDTKAAEQEKGLTFDFDVSSAKKYNTANFRNSTAVAKKITKNGILATVQPDGVDILVGFDDITEQAVSFFKKKK